MSSHDAIPVLSRSLAARLHVCQYETFSHASSLCLSVSVSVSLPLSAGLPAANLVPTPPPRLSLSFSFSFSRPFPSHSYYPVSLVPPGPHGNAPYCTS